MPKPGSKAREYPYPIVEGFIKKFVLKKLLSFSFLRRILIDHSRSNNADSLKKKHILTCKFSDLLAEHVLNFRI